MNIKAYLAVVLASLGVWSAGNVIAQDVPPGSPADPVAVWTFSDTNGWTSDAGYKPLSYTNLVATDIADGTAVVLNTNLAWLRYDVINEDATTNLVIGAPGTIMFWFAPVSWASTNVGGAGPGTWARLIEVGSYTTNASVGWLGLYADPWGQNIYFAMQTNNGTQAVYLSAPVTWTTNEFRWLVLTYSSTNTALYVDGTLATNGPGVTIWPSASATTNGFCIGSSADGSNLSRGAFDDLETFDYVMSAQTVSNWFSMSSVSFWANPLNPANFTSAPFDPPVPAPGFRAITGTGYLHLVSFATNCVTNASVWITNVTAKLTNNGTMNLTFKIAGGSPDVAYDVFGTAGLIGNSITNAQWAWLGQGYACSTYEITNLPGVTALLVLGTTNDSDGDGLTDAFEVLVSKTDPHNPDTDGDGIWDWFGVVYLGTSAVDPWASPMGDGWTLYEKFIYGLDASSFQTPPAPRDFAVSVNQSNWTAALTWLPNTGFVTGYTVTRFNWMADDVEETFDIGVTNRFVDTSYPPYTNVLNGPSWYYLTAHYVQGDSALAYAPGVPYGGLSVSTLAGPSGATVLRVGNFPPGASHLRLSKEDSDWSHSPVQYVSTNFDFTLGVLTNGFLTLPQAWTVTAPNYTRYWAQAVWPNGFVGQAIGIGSPQAFFYDGRLQVEQNLAFALRAANLFSSFNYYLDNLSGTAVQFPTNYAFASINFGPFSGSAIGSGYRGDLVRPFEDNWLCRNFVFAATNIESTEGSLSTGVSWDDLAGDVMPDSPKYTFQMPTNGLFPGYLAAADTTWIVPHDDPSLAGLSTSTNLYTVRNNVSNWFGLRLESVEVTGPGPTFLNLSPGQSAGHTNTYFFPDFDQPSLTTVGYWFGGYNTDNSSALQGPMPGDASFSPSSPSPVLVASLGSTYTAVGYAQQLIGNGDHGRPAYLGQYFDYALQLDTNGVPTTNSAGIISGYGDFFATQPGAAALITMTNWGVNERGTGVVHVVALCTDANHDGVIDPTFFGPDQTTQDHPFRFWANENQDVGEDGGNGIPLPYGYGDGMGFDILPG